MPELDQTVAVLRARRSMSLSQSLSPPERGDVVGVYDDRRAADVRRLLRGVRRKLPDGEYVNCSVEVVLEAVELVSPPSLSENLAARPIEVVTAHYSADCRGER